MINKKTETRKHKDDVGGWFSPSYANQPGTSDEDRRKRRDGMAPIGSMVTARAGSHGYSIVAKDLYNGKRTTYASHDGPATVIGVVDCTQVRYVMLNPPWKDQEGHTVVFAQIDVFDPNLMIVYTPPK